MITHPTVITKFMFSVIPYGNHNWLTKDWQYILYQMFQLITYLSICHSCISELAMASQTSESIPLISVSMTPPPNNNAYHHLSASIGFYQLPLTSIRYSLHTHIHCKLSKYRNIFAPYNSGILQHCTTLYRYYSIIVQLLYTTTNATIVFLDHKEVTSILNFDRGQIISILYHLKFCPDTTRFVDRQLALNKTALELYNLLNI